MCKTIHIHLLNSLLSHFFSFFSLSSFSVSHPLSLSLAIFKLLSRRSRRIGFLDRRGGEAGGTAAMGVVAGGQRDRHRDRRLVGLGVLTWWPVSGFGGRRLVG